MSEKFVQTYASVWDALEETPEAAASMRLRSELMIAVRAVVEQWQVTQTQAARRLGVTLPRLNDLLRGRIDRFSQDSLVRVSERARLAVHLEVAPAVAYAGRLREAGKVKLHLIHQRRSALRPTPVQGRALRGVGPGLSGKAPIQERLAPSESPSTDSRQGPALLAYPPRRTLRHRPSATSDHTPSTSPNGHAPCRNP